MKIVAYTALLYGREYLRWAIRSVIDYIDQYVVLYTSEGSHGTHADEPCPESREDLYVEARAAAGDKLLWYDGSWTYEGAQRDTIFQLVPDADAVIVLDADEIWPCELIKAAVRYIYDPLENDLPHKYIRVPMIHFWRSFHRAVLHDPAYPYRIIFPQTFEGWGEETMFQSLKPICHFGYAQSAAVTRYKLKTHGHISQFRHDIDWFQDRFLANAQFDCHPVGSDYWNPEAVEPLDYLPAWMAEHPYFWKDVIP